MKVLHVTPAYAPAWSYGGPAASVHGLCQALAGHGVEVEVFTTDADGPGRLDVRAGEQTVYGGVPVTYFARTTPRRVHRAPGMARALEQRVGSFDLVHLHGVFTWPTLAARRACQRAGVPWVLSPRGMLDPETIRARGKLRKAAWIRLFDGPTVEGARLVHATSALEAERARCVRLRWPRIEVIPNGVAASPGPLDEATVAEPLRRLADRGPLVLFLGRLSWKKGLDLLVDALASVPDAHLVLAGPDDEGLAESLRRRARSHGIAERVTFTGRVNGADKRFLLRSADVLALPSLSENFGNVVLEALAEGTPVVTTPGVGAASIVADSGLGEVVERTPLALALGLSRCLSLDASPERYREVVSDFTWERLAERWKDAYGSCARVDSRRAA